MKIIVSGGGPSGLYFALLARKRLGAEVRVYEQNPRGATHGFGIVIPDRGLDRFKDADEQSYRMIMASCFISRHRILIHREERIFIEGGGYGGGIARLRLLEILEECCELVGVQICHGRRFDASMSPQADLIVGADGVNSAVRNTDPEAFGTTSYSLKCKLAWYGTAALFPYPILCFRKTELGQFWAAGAAYTDRMSTFVAECDAETWQRALAHLDDEERIRIVEEVFAPELQGHRLISNRSIWNSLPVTRVRNWFIGNRVLIGDALHSAHPSIGSGTRIAMEDSIALVDALDAERDIAAGLARFRRDREPAKQKLVRAAEKSFNWYETIADRLDGMDAPTLMFDYLTRTGRIDKERLDAEFPQVMARYEQQWRAFAA